MLAGADGQGQSTAASSSVEHSATGDTAVGAASPSQSLMQRYPPFVVDNRFAEDGSDLFFVQCDDCHVWFSDSGAGAFVPQSRFAKDRAEGWAAGTLDARWYCLACWAMYYVKPVEGMKDFLGLKRSRAPPTIGFEDERFTIACKRHRIIFCDRCRQACRGLDSGYFVNRHLPPFPKRQHLWLAGELNMTFYCRTCYGDVEGSYREAAH